MTGVECPTCGRDDFANRRGMRAHHARVHGESLVGSELDADLRKPWQDFDRLRELYRDGERTAELVDRFGCTKKTVRDWLNRALQDTNLGHHCPDCGDVFGEEDSLKVHHSKKHDGSIAGVPVTCEWCEEVKRFKPSEAKQRRFCSDECQNEWQRDHFAGENNPNYSDAALEYECTWCGETRQTFDKREYNNRFCSAECRDAWKSEYLRGENHHQWAGRVEMECEQCGDTRQVEPSKVETFRFCSRGCLGQWQSENVVGENHHLWKDGGVHYYGPNWGSQRRARLEKDDHTCQACQRLESEFDESLHVHHIRRLGWFKENYPEPEWWEEGNALDNLIALCRGCHQKWEGIPLRPTA